MFSNILGRVFAAFVLLALAGPAAGAEHAAPPSEASASGIAEARALIEDGRFDEALAVLRPLLEGDTVAADALFFFGLAAVETSRRTTDDDAEREALLDEAIEAFRAMLVNRPELVRVRLELARAFFLKGEDRLARRHFERVLAGDPPPAVTGNVRRFLAEIRARRRWSLYVGAALAPDTNIGAASSERTIYIQGLPFQRDAEDLTTSGIGVSVWGGGEYQHPLGERVRLRAGADASRREYAGSVFDQTSLSLHTGPRMLVGENAEASVLASASQRWLGGVPDHREAGVRLQTAGRFGRRLTAHARASWHDRSYRDRTYLDGPVVDASFGGAWIAAPTVRLDANAGWGRERPESERWRHQRRWVRAGIAVALPYGFTVGGSGELRRTDYKGNWSPFTPDGEARADRTRSLRLSVLNRAFTLRGFSPQLALVHERRDTNAQLYDYKRTGGELSFVRQF